MISGVHSTRWTQSGGEETDFHDRGEADDDEAEQQDHKTAGPSPASWAERSRPQTGQLCRTVSSPVNSAPSPHRGQWHNNAARSSDTGA